MDEIEEALITFIERKESLNETIYLTDLTKFLKEFWDYTLEESLGLIECCITEEWLEIKSVANLYDLNKMRSREEITNDADSPRYNKTSDIKLLLEVLLDIRELIVEQDFDKIVKGE